jgi:BRCT domain type II-containing protein
VAGAEPGAAKVAKAEECGVPVIDEEAFLRLLETGESEDRREAEAHGDQGDGE